MKKKLIGLISFLTVLFCLSASAENADDLDKSVRKECKKAAKEFTKQGWNVFGKSKTIEEALTAHYRQLGSQAGMTTIESRAEAKDLNLAIRKCQNSAALQYASMQETKIEGTTSTHVTSTSGSETSSQTELDAQYQSSTGQVVKSLSPSVVFYRTKADGGYEVRSLFIVKSL